MSPRLALILFCAGLALFWEPLVTGSSCYAQDSDLSETETIEELETLSGKLYSRARELYDMERYWECARDLIILIDFYPKFSKSDDVFFLLGDCLFQMELYQGASRIFKYLVKRHIRSPQLPYALLWMQKIEYHQHDYEKCLEYFKAISRGNPDDKVLNASRYYTGKSYYALKNYPAAIDILKNINNTSEYYDYALYDVSMSLLRMKRVRDAVKTLRSLVSLPVISPERVGIIDEGRLTLGYIFYELGYHRESFKQFKNISSGYKNYDSALLAAGWAAIKMERYQDAVVPLTQLVKGYENNPNAEEGFFLLGRCYLKLGYYDHAIKVYEKLVTLFPEEWTVPRLVREVNDGLTDEKARIEQLRLDLLMLETRLLDVIPISDDGSMPEYLREERKRIQETRNALLERIASERELFNLIANNIIELEKVVRVKESRKDWRGYAEYGKSRALFLKQSQVNMQ